MLVQEVAELERRLGDQTVISHDAERRAKRAEMAVIEAEEQLHNLDKSLHQRDDLQHQLIADHKQVSKLYTGCLKPSTQLRLD